MTQLLIIDADSEDARQVAWMLGNVDGEAFKVRELDALPDDPGELEEWGFDLLLLAVEGDDLAPLEKLRQGLPTLPVILLGRQSDDELGRRAIRLGAQDYLVKSRLDPAGLGRCVLHALERSRCAANRHDAVANGINAVLDHLPHGVLFLDRSLKVLFSNRPARALLTADAPLRIGRDQRLRVMDAEEGHLLGGLIHATLRGEMEERGRALLLGGSGDHPLAVMVATLGENGSGAALFISDPHTPPAVARDTLTALYRLTPAEAKLVALLARGLTLDAIAERAHVSPHTLRTQLKQVFRKTGTSRQSELLKLILTGPAVIAAGS